MNEIISKMLHIVANSEGMHCEVDFNHGLATWGPAMDAYLLAMVLKEFIDIGDITFTMSNDPKSPPNRVDYLRRLMEDVHKLEIPLKPPYMDDIEES